MSTANPTVVNTKHADEGLEDLLMRCDPKAFAVVCAWGHLQESLEWSPRLARWLNDACKCERDRREMKTTTFPSFAIVHGWTNREIAGGLGLACMLCDAAVDPLSEHFARKARNAMIAATTARLLDGEPIKEEKSCDDS